MQINPVIAAALEQVAWQYQADLQALHAAIEHESGAELAAVLGLDRAIADHHMNASQALA
jgi:hypothetical protein